MPKVMTKREELDALLEDVNRKRREQNQRELQFYITNPGDHDGKRYQLVWKNSGSNATAVMNRSEMEIALRLAYEVLN